MLSALQLRKIYIYANQENLDEFLEPLNQTMEEFEINTPQRIRMFLAQIGHESSELRYVQELATGLAYEGRKDLGNVETGDGVRYKGRGLIQITGRSNYSLCGEALHLPILDTPSLLEVPLNAATSAGWFWKSKNLNSLADLNLFDKITQRINGGMNGEANRKRLYQLAFTYVK